MQRLVTIVINQKKLKGATKGAFSITDVGGINRLMQEGWSIQDWQIMTAESGDDKVTVFMILNDDLADQPFGAFAYTGADEPEEDRDAEDPSGYELHHEGMGISGAEIADELSFTPSRSR